MSSPVEDQKVHVIEYAPKGGAAELFRCRDPEVLIEGPAGTGKTRASLEYLNFVCERFPNLRVAICRKTRKSMSESVLQTWEDHVLWPGHPAIVGDASRHNRFFYTYPNGSHVVVAGLDNPDKIMSTEFDVVFVAEATEASLEDWDKLNSRLRNHKLPWNEQAIADCNPGSQYHWLNQRANKGMMTRILSRHEDNPHVDAPYLRKLRNLTGARRDRLYLGLWVSEEGLVYDNWDPARHVVDVTWELKEKIKWTFASVDWGFRNPGCLQVWGVDGDSNMYMLAEVYRAQKDLDWWAEQVIKLDEEFDGLQTIVCDPAEPRSIQVFNDRLGEARGRPMASVCRKADNDIMAGVDMLRWGMGQDGETPRMFFGRNVLRGGRCPECDESMAPACTTEEFPGIVWLKAADGKPVRELPDPACPDHGENAARYAAMWAWNKDLAMEEKEHVVDDSSYAHWAFHRDVDDTSQLPWQVAANLGL